MLKGFMVPRSPLGLACIDPPPPWHYSGDVLAVEFWADPAVTASLLPQGLSSDPKTNGHAFAMFIDWGGSSRSRRHPAKSFTRCSRSRSARDSGTDCRTRSQISRSSRTSLNERHTSRATDRKRALNDAVARGRRSILRAAPHFDSPPAEQA
jgi:hypothetical protein